MTVTVTEPMQIHPAECDGKCPTQGAIVVEDKLDGHRAILQMGGGLECPVITSKHVSKKTEKLSVKNGHLPHIIDIATDMSRRGLGFTVFDGEVVIPGCSVEEVQTVLGSSPEKSLAWQEENLWAEYRVFDLLFYNGRDVRSEPWSVRTRLVYKLMSDANIGGINKLGHMSQVEWFMATQKEADLKFKSLATGKEGIMRKDVHGAYGCGWTKQKVVSTYDVVIMGFTPGKGKYQGLFGAIEFGVSVDGKLKKVGQCSGLPDGYVRWVDSEGNHVGPNEGQLQATGETQPEGSRAWFFHNKDVLIGSVIEVRANKLTKKGNLRHPRFVRMRYDKPPEQCLAPKQQS